MSVTDGVLSIHSRNLPDSDALRGLPDSQDPTYQDCWPSERYPSDGPERVVSTTAIGTCCTNQHDYTPESAWAYMANQVDATVKEPLPVDQCECCRAAPGMPHAIGCEAVEERLTYHPHADGVRSGRETPRNLPVGAPNEYPTWVCRDCGQDQPNENATWHMDTCGICGREMSVTEPRDFGGHHSIFQEQAIFPLVESSGDVKVESCPECGTVTDIDYGPDLGVCHKRETPPVEETPSVPFPVQSWTFEALIETEINRLHEIIDDHHDEIVQLARKRHREGFVTHGSKMYSWSPERRLDETLQELADAGVYPTSGPIE